MLQVQLFAIALFVLMAVSIIFADVCNPNPEPNFLAFKEKILNGGLFSGSGDNVLANPEIDAMLEYTL